MPLPSTVKAEQVRQELAGLAREVAGLPDGDYERLAAALRSLTARVEELIEGSSAPPQASPPEGAPEPPGASPRPVTTAEMEIQVSGLSEGFVMLDPDWRILYANRAAARTGARPAEDLTGKLFWEEFPGLVDTPLFQHFHRVMEQREPVAFTYRGKFNDVWYEVKAYPTPGGLTATWQNRTRQEQEEQVHEQFQRQLQRVTQSAAESENLARELSRYARQLETIINHLAAGVIVFDRKGRVTLTNAAAASILGFDPLHLLRDEILSRLSLWNERGEPLSPDQAPSALAARGERSLDQLITLTNPSGRAYHLRVSASPLYLNNQLEGVVSIWHDVTEQHALLQENREKSEILQTILEQMPQGVIIAEAPSGKLVLGNQQVEQIWRHAFIRSQAVGEYELYRGFHEDGRPYLPEEWPLARALNTGELVQGEEIGFLRGDQTYGTMSVSAAPVFDAAGQIITAVMIFEDISQRKDRELALLAANNALAKAEQKMRSILNSVTDCYFFIDRDWRFVEINDSALKYLDARREELLGQPVWEVYPATQGTYIEENYRKALETGQTVHFEIKSITVPRWADVHVYPGEDGLAIYFCDITERKQFEAQLRESERRFRLALANTPVIVFSQDLDLRYTWVYNPRGDFTAGSMIGRRDEDLLDPASAAKLTAIKREALDTGQMLRREVAFQAQGRPVVYDLTVEPLRDEEGQPAGIIAAAFDLSELRALEAKELEHKALVEGQRRLLDYRENERQEIARDIHDGPIQSLVSVLFNLQYAQDTYGHKAIPEALEAIKDQLRFTVRELREVVNDLRPPALIGFGLAKTLRIHAEDFRDRHPGIRLHLELFEDENRLPSHVRLALFRIYQEGLSNVVRHAEASEVWVRFYRAGDDVVLEIEDNGKGFVSPRNWTEPTRRNQFGLAGMRERAEAIGGQFEVISHPRAGAIVRVTAPWVEEA